MTKKEIVKTISEEIGLTQLKTKEIVQKTFDAIVKALVEEKRIELRNFGVFEVKKRAARKARNPRTGQRVDVPQKFVVTFKPGKEMEERVRHLERQAAEVAVRPRAAQERLRPSADVGAEKPHPPIFLAALQRAGCAPDEALHVGDQYHSDVVGARNVGITPLLLDRTGLLDPARYDVPVIRSLMETAEHLEEPGPESLPE